MDDLKSKRPALLYKTEVPGAWLLLRLLKFTLNELNGDGKGLDAAFGQSDLGFAAGGVSFSLQGPDGLTQLVQGGVDLTFCLLKMGWAAACSALRRIFFSV